MLPLPKLKLKSHSYKRLDEAGQRRLLLENAYQEIISSDDVTLKNKLELFLSIETHNDSFLLSGTQTGMNSIKLRSHIPTFTMHCLVCVKIGNYNWSEEYMGINNSDLVFIKYHQKALIIPINKIIKVKMNEFSESELVMPGIFTIIITTFSRQYKVMIRGADIAEAWVSMINKFKEEKCEIDAIKYSESHSISDNINIHIENFSMDLISYPKGWKLGDRIILNCRNYSLQNNDIIDNNIKLLDYLLKSPHHLVAHLLDVVMTLSEQRDSEESTHDELWMYFMDSVSLLQSIDISSMDLSSDEAMCLFLNLYHCMIIHSYLVVGLPTTMNKWTGFFNHCSYEAFGDIFSISEMEHCIIRRGMHKPKLGLIVNQYIPTTDYDFYLNRRDYRLVWAMNCSSSSLIPQVPIYNEYELNNQLEEVANMSIDRMVSITDKNVISICQLFRWCKRDFEFNLDGNELCTGIL